MSSEKTVQSGRRLISRRFASLVTAGVLLALTTPSPAQPESGQSTFASPEDASRQLLEAVKAGDKPTLRLIFGTSVSELLSGDDVQDRADLQEFAAALTARNELVPAGDDRVILHIGAQHYPFAIPIVRSEGKWYFDTPAGKEEIINRRIGENELGAIRVCRGYVVAQFEYAAEDRDGDDVLEYATSFASTPGTQSGLYWETSADEPPSPLGPLVAQARNQGYGRRGERAESGPQPYHGYVYKLLTRQGRRAPGGRHNYIINGNMVAGFAMVASPVSWGESGIMTFIVNSNGKVYEKNLDENTASIVGKMESYDVDSSWSLVKE